MTIPTVYGTRVASYPGTLPYSPSEKYPEYPFGDIGAETNLVYDGLRRLLRECGYDARHFGHADWNPLGDVIRPGQTVLIKPNWVKHVSSDDIDILCFITHSSLIRAVADYALIALQGSGRLIIGDAPIQSASFDSLKKQTGISEIATFLGSQTRISVEVMDFRLEVASMQDGIVARRDVTAVTHVPVRMTLESEHGMERDFDKYRVTHYDPRRMSQHHNNTVHEYLIAEPALQADVIINVPKLKTHRKAGITCSLKNQIGINASKDWLPHHSIGSTTHGGDEYEKPSVLKFLLRAALDSRERASSILWKRLWNLAARFLKKCRKISLFESDPFFEGSWHGNDTLWRTILDLNKIVFFADRQGIMQKEIQRKLLYLVDGVVIGEGEGPLHPSRKDCGLLMWGENPVHVDVCAAAFIGFDPSTIKSLDRAFEIVQLPITKPDRASVACRLDGETWRPYVDGGSMAICKARPSAGWKGHMEWEASHDAITTLTDDDEDY